MCMKKYLLRKLNPNRLYLLRLPAQPGILCWTNLINLIPKTGVYNKKKRYKYMFFPEISHQSGAFILILISPTKELCLPGWHQGQIYPNYFKVFCFICSRGCEHQLPPLRTHTKPCFSREMLFLCRGLDRVAATLLQQQPPVCQGWQPALASACSRHRVWVSNSCLTRHRSLQGLKAGRRLIRGENAAFAWGRKPFSIYNLPPHPLWVPSLAQGSKSPFPYCFWLPMTSLFPLFPPKTERAAACEMSVLNKVWGPTSISAIISCPLKNHSPPQSATENPSLCAGTCHLPSPLPHYTKIYALASAGLCLPEEMRRCPAKHVTLCSSCDTVLQGLLNPGTDSCSRGKQAREIFIVSPQNFSKAHYRSFTVSRCLHPSLLCKAHTHILRYFAEL